MTGIEVAVGATLLSSAVGAASAISQGQQQAALADFNAQVAEDEAQAAIDAAALAEEQDRARSEALISTGLAQAGASGVRGDTGAPLIVLAENTAQAELDAQTIRFGGAVGAARGRSKASALKVQGDFAESNSFVRAGATLLTGASRAGDLLGGASPKKA